MYRLIYLSFLLISAAGIWSFVQRRRMRYPLPETLIIEPPFISPPRHPIMLEGVFNFRDLGGYKTVDGRCIQWGKLYRSGTLSDLTPRDWQRFEQIGVKLICDLRTYRERQVEPVTPPDNHVV
jgi:hypothetical protein